ncbi:MAG TPA: heme o synthase [Candidatus Dormibacteraeota bacterium]|nr:heme o synthase [Candidatus Dormibacteraeota bacterium]
MNRVAEAIGSVDARATGQVFANYLALTKPRLVTMVVITAAAGFYLGAPGAIPAALFIHAMIGTALAAAGALALNQYLERDLDACMDRTRRRPLPAGRVQPLAALLFGGALTVVGLGQLLLAVNPLACAVTAVTSTVYLFVYTPLKRVTPLCTIVGAVPGALPPVTGWVAARGEFGDGALVLFAILFLWQIPHSLAIARLYADQYADAGFRLLPVVEPHSHRTERAVVSYSFALVAVGMTPALLGMAGSLYLASALVLGGGMLVAALAFGVQRAGSARWLLLASLVYLPVLLSMMAFDRVGH